MRHRRSRLRLTQKPDHAKLLQRNLVTSLLLYEAVRTTHKRAKVIQPIVDRLIATAKAKPPHVAIRAMNRVVTDKNASRKVMEVLRARYAGRPSGFTRMVPAGARKGDGAELVDLSLIDSDIGQRTADRGREKANSTEISKSEVRSPVSSRHRKNADSKTTQQ